MKTIVTILSFAIFVFGCGRETGREKFEVAKMTWRSDVSTNSQLIIYDANGGKLKTTVDSLDEAANLLGQHGWEFVSTDVEGGNRVYYMRRHSQKDGEFVLIPNYVLSLPPQN